MKTLPSRLSICILACLGFHPLHAQDAPTYAESKIRSEIALARALVGVTNIDERVVLLKPKFETPADSQLNLATPMILDPGSAHLIRVYSFVPSSVIIPAQRLYETTVVSSVTLVDPIRIISATNAAPSVSVEHALSSVLIPVSDSHDLKVEQITLPNLSTQLLR